MTAIVYASTHHGNTKKVLDAIAAKYEVDLIDATKVHELDISKYDCIGFASGIYFSKFHQSVINFANVNLPGEMRVFLICTYGGTAVYSSMEEICKAKDCKIIGEFGCPGFDTYGPFKIVGGLKKGHPDEKDIQDALEFFGGLESL